MNKSTKKKVATGVGLGLATAAAATGAYLMTGKHGEQNRKKLKAWAMKAQKEVLRQAKKMEKMSRPAYEALVDKVTEGYADLKDVDKKDLVMMVRDLKKHWSHIQKEFTGARAALVKRIKPTVKKKPTKPRKK